MKINFDFFSILIFLGILQSFALSIIVITIKKGNKKANIFLSLYLLTAAVSMGSHILYNTNLYYYLPHLCRIVTNIQLLLGPFLYFYIKHLSSTKTKFKAKNLFHFIPFVLYFLFWSKFYFSPGKYKIEYMQNWLNGGVTGTFFYFEIIGVILILINISFYIIQVFLLLKRHEKKIKNNYSNIEKINLSWLKYLLIIFLLFYGIIGLLFTAFIIFNIQYSIIIFLITFSASIFTYFLGFRGLTQKEIFLNNIEDKHLLVKKILTREESGDIFKRLLKYIENKKPYKNENLTLNQLSRNLLISVNKLASVINNYLGQNFYNFINSYRIKESKKYLQTVKNIDLEKIRSKVGFKSKMSFIKSFKYFNQTTPHNYHKNFLLEKKSKVFRTIGIFIECLNDNFGMSIFNGINKAAKEKNCNLICFNGGTINSPYSNYKQKTTVYDLVNVNNIDGIIAISSKLGTFINKEEIINFYNRFKPIPIVSVGMDIEGLCSIWIDNKKGIKDMLVHLIEEHGYRKIAYIDGPENNIDSINRLKIYREVLTEYKINYAPELIVSGIFISSSGKEAVKILLDDRKVKIDAIFAANDYMAIHAVKELQSRGIRIPEDIAVVGVDDVPESSFLTKPLTTVSQPTFEMGYKAALKLLNLINKEDVIEKNILHTGLIIRKSCGCGILSKDTLSYNKRFKKKFFPITIKKLNEYFIPEIQYLMFSKYGGIVNAVEISDWISKLLIELFLEIQNKQKNKFLYIQKDIIEKTVSRGVDIDFWKSSILIIFKTLQDIIKDSDIKNKINSLFRKSVDLIELIYRNIKEKPLLQNSVPSEDLFSIKQALLTVYDFENFKKVLLEKLLNTGIKSCYLSIYEDDSQGITGRNAKLVFAFQNGVIKNFTSDETKFIDKNLVPGGLNNPLDGNNIFFLMSLYYIDRKIGFIVFEANPENITFLELFVLEINSTFNRINLQSKLQTQSVVMTSKKTRLIRYGKSGLSIKMSEEYYKRLLDFMKKEKIYTNPNLTLSSLAKHFQISKNHLSHVINGNSGLNFFDFINSYRIEEAKNILKTNKGNKIDIQAVAYNSGFKAKSTFNKVFKKYVQMTPTEYKNIFE